VVKGYCAAHQHVQKKINHDRNQWTGSAHRRGYGQAWRKLRAQVLARDVVCVAGWVCGGRSLATEADHIIAKEDGGQDSMENVRGLCSACHRFRHVCDRRGETLPPYTTFEIP
jgi:5-methylcytosine-specific restriction protein A